MLLGILLVVAGIGASVSGDAGQAPETHTLAADVAGSSPLCTKTRSFENFGLNNLRINRRVTIESLDASHYGYSK